MSAPEINPLASPALSTPWVPLWPLTPATPPYSAPSYGTSLPGSPVDGQEAILVDSVTDPLFQWRFRYNAGNTTAHKWEFIGGRDAEVVVNTQEGLASPAGWQNLPTDGASFTIPVTGVYTVEVYCQALGQTNQTGGFMGPATGNNDPPWSSAFYAAGTGWSGVIVLKTPEWNIPAGTVVKQRYTATASDLLFSNRHLRVTPKRALAS